MIKYLSILTIILLTLTLTGCDEAALTAAQTGDSSYFSSSSTDTLPIDTIPIDTSIIPGVSSSSSSSISTSGISPTLPTFMYNRPSPVDTVISVGITTKVLMDNVWKPIDTLQYNMGYSLIIMDWGLLNHSQTFYKYYIMGEGDYFNDAGSFHEYSVNWEVKPGATVPFMGGQVLLMEGSSMADNGTAPGTVHAYLMYIVGKVAIAYWWDTCTYQGPSFCDANGLPQRYLIL